jgi:endonuclease VIII
MDQTVAAGVGNIFRAELLYRARLSPFIAGKDVPAATLRAMWKDLLPLMRAAMIDRRIVTTKVADRPSGDKKAPKEETHYVYRRNGHACFVCGTTIEKKEMAGRNLFWCPVCQAT